MSLGYAQEIGMCRHGRVDDEDSPFFPMSNVLLREATECTFTYPTALTASITMCGAAFAARDLNLASL
eukprot:scaffold128519_cov22-Tisochrysis_lutea.AAC.1